MVADASTQAQLAATASKKKKRPTVSHGPNAWPIEAELAVRAAYLGQGLPPQRIADEIITPKWGRSRQAVRSLITTRGWSKLLAHKREQVLARTDARMDESVSAVVEATATMAEQAALAGLRRATEAATNGKAMNKGAAQAFRAWSGGARDLVGIHRLARGLDKAEQTAGTTNMMLNLFCVHGDIRAADASTAQPVQPIVDLPENAVRTEK